MKKTVDNSTFLNDWYKPGRSKFILILWYYVNVFYFQNPFNPFSGLKIWLLRLFGAHVGEGVVIKPNVNIKYPWRLHIGNHSWIGEGVWIDNLADVRLESNVCLSQGCMLLTGNHNYKKTSFDLIVQPIHLETGVWIGAQAVVCPGVRCHSHAILGVSSVANTDLEAYTIYQGNPALPVRPRIIT